MVYACRYAIHELEAAIAKCDVASDDMNNAAVHARATHRSALPTPCPFPSVRTAESVHHMWAQVHALDEGVAFYTGALEGEDGSGSGKLMYALSDKR